MLLQLDRQNLLAVAAAARVYELLTTDVLEKMALAEIPHHGANMFSFSHAPRFRSLETETYYIDRFG